MDEHSPWLRRLRRHPRPRVRLVCFPHGGAGAGAFASWPALLPADVELLAVQFPGREDRTADPFPRDVSQAAEEISGALAPLLDAPYVLFGHSLGATVAYELAQRLQAGGHALPRHVVASGREAPPDERGGDVHRRDDDGVLAEIVRLGGTDGEVLAHPELRAMVVRCVREDYRLIENYRHGDRPPLDCPVTVFLGDRDPDLTPVQARRWSEVTRHPVRVRVFPGGHFYLVPRRDEVVAALLGIARSA